MNAVDHFTTIHPDINQSIGLHIRAGDQEESCNTLKHFNLWKLFFSCYIKNSKEVFRSIESVMNENSKKNLKEVIYVATNDFNTSEVMSSLYKRYGDKLLYLNTLEKSQEKYRPIVEALLLDRTGFFIGNFHSTFTSNAILRREYKNYKYFRTYFEDTSVELFMIVAYSIPIVLFVIILFFWFISLICCGRSRKNILRKALATEVFIFAILFTWFFILPFRLTFSIYWSIFEPFVCYFTPFCKKSPWTSVLIKYSISTILLLGLICMCYFFLKIKRKPRPIQRTE